LVDHLRWLELSVPGLVGSFPDNHDKLRRVAWCPEIDGIPSHLVYGRDSVDIVWRLAVGSALNESLPVNSTDRTRVLLRLLSVTRNDDVSADLALLAVERAVSLLEAAIDRQTNLSTGTKSRVIAQVKREAQQLGVPIPGRSTLYEALGNLHRSKHPFGNAATRRSQANRPDRAWGGQSPSRPGELVEIDSTPLWISWWSSPTARSGAST
jgi:hypothetical protein